MTRLYNGYQLFSGLLWWLPVFYLYQRNAGLTDEQIFTIQSIYYVFFCLLEIPTGALADRFDYRRFLLAGAGTLLVANLLPVFWPVFWGFLVHFLLVALANSLVSGAGSAYLYEYLVRSGVPERYRKAEGNARAASLIGRVACLPLAGFLMQWHTPLPYLLTAAGAAVAVLLAARLPALPGGQRQPDKAEREPLAQALTGAVRLVTRSKLLMLLIVQGVAVFTLVRVLQTNLFQPILAAKDLPVAAFGSVLAANALFEVAGAARSALVRRWLSDTRAIFVLTTVLALLLALLVPAGLAATIALMCVFSLVSGVAYPIQRQLVNDAITDPSRRATVLSVESIVDRLVCSLVVLALGAYLSAGALNLFLLHLAIGTVVLMTVLAVFLRRANRRRAPEAVSEGRTR
ncbi:MULTISPECIES: MFS transporter [unclassified Crossiella]|uniref:MFS transporter n=1 Tax=unclassified Crossiella TaxID=2620835 RepID=UPI001FFEA060|nr:MULTISPECIES: MFS transporter [unclassified Crossiella]MCK2239215.1 MFS transporter [Crossiella sp. S99.2]MCK2251216.1 MFS transporter [Crossiella sp. S99.1]